VGDYRLFVLGRSDLAEETVGARTKKRSGDLCKVVEINIKVSIDM
jgi:hypothetical protein